MEKLARSFPWAASELSPPLTLGSLGQIHEEFQGSGNGLIKPWNIKFLDAYASVGCTLSLTQSVTTKDGKSRVENFVHYLCTIFALSLHSLCIISALSFHHLWTIFAISLHCLCTIFALTLHYLCTNFALSLYYLCTIFALSLHSLHYLRIRTIIAQALH